MPIILPGSSQDLCGVRFLDTTTAFKFVPGEETQDLYGSIWQYVRASAAIAQYAYVKVSADGNFTAQELTTTNAPATEPATLGCAQIAFASGEYGWVFRGYGYHIGKFAASTTQDTKIYTSAAPGVASSSAATLITGLKLITTTVAAGSATAFATGYLRTVDA